MSFPDHKHTYDRNLHSKNFNINYAQRTQKARLRYGNVTLYVVNLIYHLFTLTFTFQTPPCSHGLWTLLPLTHTKQQQQREKQQSKSKDRITMCNRIKQQKLSKTATKRLCKRENILK